MFRRALEEGIVEPSRMLQAGIRGPLYGEADEEIPATLGVDTIPWIELAEMTPADLAARARSRLGDGPAFLSLDVDFVDAAFCPGTGTPEVGGPTSFQALSFLRALAGLPFVGYDVVEVAPAYDGPGQVTALFAANVVFEMLSMVTLQRRATAGSGRGRIHAALTGDGAGGIASARARSIRLVTDSIGRPVRRETRSSR